MHFESADDPAVGDATVPPSCTQWTQRLELLEFYRRWAERDARSVSVLMPEAMRNGPEHDMPGLGSTVPLWYSHRGAKSFPPAALRAEVCMVNGSQLPLVDWTAARATFRHLRADVVIFGSDGADTTPRYAESVVVGPSGELVSFQRHYDDSTSFADVWDDDASFLMVSGRHAQAVVNHVLARGWGLPSVGAMTRRFSVRWAGRPCVVAGFGVSPGAAAALDLPRGSKASTQEPDGMHGAAESLADQPWEPRSGWAYRSSKRALDILTSVGGLVLMSPFLAIVALLVKATSRGPVLFGHKRQGLGGKEFRCWKFRSMRQGAEALQDSLRIQNEVDGPQFKIEHDPRLTPIGDWLRRTYVDELPQLLNVLLGRMSLVGPRPSPDDENQLCPAWRRARLSVKPGITGLWQVLRMRDADHSDFQEWIYYDVEYARHRSLWLDLQIILYTLPSMFAPGPLGGFAERLRRRGICKHSARLSDTNEPTLHLAT